MRRVHHSEKNIGATVMKQQPCKQHTHLPCQLSAREFCLITDELHSVHSTNTYQPNN